MSRKTKLGYRSNKQSEISAAKGDMYYDVWLNGNYVYGCVKANIKRGFVEVVSQPFKFVNGTVKTHKLRGRVKVRKMPEAVK